MDISDRMKKKRRSLPVYLLVDTSGSMQGEKIGTVNVAIKEMIGHFRKIENPKGIIQLAIFAFGNNEVTVSRELADLSRVEYVEFEACGNTPMGLAFEQVTEMIEDHYVRDTRDYPPTVILISDGNPTDFEGYHEGMSTEEILNWDALKKTHDSVHASETTRLALGIGDDVDTRILNAFINDEYIPVIKAVEVDTISKFFRWVTVNMTNRSESANPSKAADFDPYVFDQDEMEPKY